MGCQCCKCDPCNCDDCQCCQCGPDCQCPTKAPAKMSCCAPKKVKITLKGNPHEDFLLQSLDHALKVVEMCKGRNMSMKSVQKLAKIQHAVSEITVSVLSKVNLNKGCDCDGCDCGDSCCCECKKCKCCGDKKKEGCDCDGC